MKGEKNIFPTLFIRASWDAFKTMILTRSHVSCPYQATIEDYRVIIIQQEEILAKITLHIRTDHTPASWVEKPSL
jgi:hypothetical protein